MGTFNDLTDRQFGEWTAKKYLGNSMWECECSCGKIKAVHRYSLIRGASTSCGHSKKSTDIKEIKVGMQINNWEVLENLGNGLWLCRCSCGKIGKVNTASLRYGYSKSCGCKQGEYQRNTLYDRYSETNTTRIDNPREDWQLRAMESRENLEEFLKQYNCKLNTTEICQLLDIQRPALLKALHKFELEELVDLSSFVSNSEKELREYISSIYEGQILFNDKSTINPFELDILLPERKIAFEFNGNYWHSTMQKSKKYHIEKTQACARKRIQLIHIFEYEWNNEDTQSKLKKYIADLIKPKDKYYARKLKIEELGEYERAEVKEFLDTNHLQGYNSARCINIGLRTSDNELIGLMTFGKPRFSNECDYELIRLCYKFGTTVIGGSKRMMKYFINHYNPQNIISYCNLSKFLGEIYSSLGFRFIEITSPNYCWVKGSEVLSRYQAQKHKLLAKGLGKYGNTETEIMINLGYLKIYDCGNSKYIWTAS